MSVSLASHRQSPRPSGAGRLEAGVHGSPAHLAPLPAPLRLVPQPEGQLQIHTAPFRGSFATVFSQALRTAGLGSRVLVSQFLKGGVDQGVAGRLRLCGRLEWLRPATLQCIATPLLPSPVQSQARVSPSAAPSSAPEATVEEELLALSAPDQTLEAVAEVWAYSRACLLEGSVDLMVLDELGLAIELGYLAADEVTSTLERRPAHLDVILTGPSMPAALMAMADQVTELRRAL
jgi:cob(I)alamin adenosyltransferase